MMLGVEPASWPVLAADLRYRGPGVSRSDRARRVRDNGPPPGESPHHDPTQEDPMTSHSGSIDTVAEPAESNRRRAET